MTVNPRKKLLPCEFRANRGATAAWLAYVVGGVSEAFLTNERIN